MAPPIRYTPESIQIAWKDLTDSQIRARGLRLSPAALKNIIPQGPYCYTVLGDVPAPKVGQAIRPCMFLRGSRPESICLINPERTFRDDLYNQDACKCCGVNDQEQNEDCASHHDPSS